MLRIVLAIVAWLLMETAPTEAEDTAEAEAIAEKERKHKERVAKVSASLVEAFRTAHEQLMTTIVPRLAQRMFDLRVLFSDSDGNPDFSGRTSGYREAIKAVRTEAEVAGVTNYESLRVMSSTYIGENIAELAGSHRAKYVRDGFASWTEKQTEKQANQTVNGPAPVSAPTELTRLARAASTASRKNTANPTGRPDVDGILATTQHALGMVAGYLDPRDKDGNPRDVPSEQTWKPNAGDVNRWTEAIGAVTDLLGRISAVVESGSKKLGQSSNRNPRTGRGRKAAA